MSLLLALALSPVHAAELELPVRLKFDEYTGWGEDPAVVDSVLSGTLAVANPATGKSFATRGSLFVVDRIGKGTGELDFAADPTGTLRTWEITLLAADGSVVGEPEVLDILFGEGGDGTITARAEADIVVKTVKIKKRGISSRQATYGGYTVQVGVTGYGTDAAYVGIRELAADGSPLGAHVDMAAMTADVYASYQGLVLDAIVPLDTWAAELEGTIAVEAVAVAGGAVEGGTAPDFEVSLHGPSVKGGSSLLQTLSFPAAQPLLLKSKKATGGVYGGRRLPLRSEDQVFDSYDGAMNLVFEGDYRALEVGALLRPVEGAPAPLSDILIALDPSGLALGGSVPVASTWPGEDKLPDEIDVDVYLLDRDKDRDIMDDIRGMPGGSLGGGFARATPDGEPGVVRYIGETLRNSEGRAVFRGLVLSRKPNGTATLRAEIVGAEFESVGAFAFAFGDPTLGTITVPTAVTYTSYSLDWTFADALADDAYTLEVELAGTDRTDLALEVQSDGDVRWTFDDGTLTPDPELPVVIWETDGAGTRSTTTSVKTGRPELK
jgi:hypothetical protein